MVRTVAALVLIACTLLTSDESSAHHSRAPFNMDALLAFQGTVVRYQWRNPHVYITVADADGNEWLLETDAVPVIAAAEVATVEVIVERPETAGQALNSGASVFVIARPAGATARMPTAVIREAATRWPLTVTLSDESSMAGQKLSALERVDIEVQISESGQPGLDNAGFVGRALGVEVGSVTPVSITPLPKQ